MNLPGYEIKGLAHICIYTKDLSKCLDFYTRILNFKKEYETVFSLSKNQIKYVLIRNGSCIIELLEPQDTQELTNSTVGKIDHFALEVKNIETAVEVLKEKGVDFIADVAQMDDLFDGIKGALIQGPNGERIELLKYI